MDGGTKTTDEIGCSNTLMNSLNELISVNFCTKSAIRKLTQKFDNHPVHSKDFRHGSLTYEAVSKISKIFRHGSLTYEAVSEISDMLR